MEYDNAIDFRKPAELFAKMQVSDFQITVSLAVPEILAPADVETIPNVLPDKTTKIDPVDAIIKSWSLMTSGKSKEIKLDVLLIDLDTDTTENT
jgi:hypothetical protein